MKNTELIELTIIIIFVFVNLFTASSVDVCNPISCTEMGIGPEIRFPFRLKPRQSDRCGYTGFDLSCNQRSQTIITLPFSGDFVVTEIDYTSQSIVIYDPDFCLVKRILDFNLTNSPFKGTRGRNYAIVNCSSDDWLNYSNYQSAIPFYCRGVTNRNHTILAMPPRMYAERKPPNCELVSTVSVPLQWEDSLYWSPMEGLRLTWSEPSCRICESQGKLCGFKSDTGFDIACSDPPSGGLPRSAKYGIILGVGIPGVVCLLAIISFGCGKVKAYSLHRRQLNNLPTTIDLQTVTITTGLDRPTIESYPKIVVGESMRLPNHDGTCPICLSEYQPKETLRSIPECSHYFHAECIDEWLKLNATCPLCRNTPESSLHTCSSSVSSSTSLVSSSS